jgi:hypothetical protein
MYSLKISFLFQQAICNITPARYKNGVTVVYSITGADCFRLPAASLQGTISTAGNTDDNNFQQLRFPPVNFT